MPNVGVDNGKFFCSCKLKNCYHTISVSGLKKDQLITYKLKTLKRKWNLKSKQGRKLFRKPDKLATSIDKEDKAKKIKIAKSLKISKLIKKL